jgi:glycosyltransferase involved in cell wall biosynthesis
MKKILLLADCNSSHIKKWGTALIQRGLDVRIFSLVAEKKTGEWGSLGIKVKSVPIAGKHKLIYPFALLSLKKAIKEFKPDIVHAHYASSYGLLGRLCKFHPFILSVWGSDVYEFPVLNKTNRRILAANFAKADKILSTSYVMVKEISKYTSKSVEVTPFGVDTKLFAPNKDGSEKKEIIIGAVKSLEHIYGFDILINAFAYIINREKLNVRLVIAGVGSEYERLIKLVKEKGIENKVQWQGWVEHSKLPDFINDTDIFVNVSRQESFGVSVVEAMACERAVVVSDVGGLSEIVSNSKTGISVPPENAEALATALKRLIENKTLRMDLGKNAREHVVKTYEWSNCVNKMMDVYNAVLK